MIELSISNLLRLRLKQQKEMKRLSKFWNRIFIVIIILFFNIEINAQSTSFVLSIRNQVQTASNKLEFDVYLLNTDAVQNFYLSTTQFGIFFNSDIYSGGSISAAIDNTNSGLGPFQTFYNTPLLSNSSSFPGQTQISLAGELAQIPLGKCTIISRVSPGTLLTHFILTNTIDFVGSTTPNLIFESSGALSPFYATRILISNGSGTSPLPVIPGTNANVYDNPVLNPPVSTPTAFNVTGGGSYCQGSGGLPVGLEDSETEVTYTLYIGADAQPGPVSGTGSAITFGNRLAGTYTVSGTNSGGTTPMTGSAVITENPNPVALNLTGSTICASPGGNGTITSTTSVSGVSYQLYNSLNSPIQGAQAGNGSGLTWTSLSEGNGYYVIATNSATCTATSTPVNVSTTANPAALVLTSSTICVSPGGNGTITSSTSVNGVNYQLYDVSNAAVQTAKAGTGSGLSWSSLPAGNGYYVIGTNGSGCTSTSNTVNVSTTANPVALVLTGSTICVSPGNDGTITSSTSTNGVNYQLYNLSNAPVQGAKAGNGSGLTWTGLSAGNGYYVIATNASTCTETSTPVNVLTTANPVALVLTGSAICASPGGNGTITSTTSVSGVNYQLYNGSNAAVQTAKAGTGLGLSWSSLPAGNGYYVIGTNAITSCVSSNSNVVDISTTVNPAALVLTGSTICASPGGNGTITSTTSVNGVNYQLYDVSNTAVQTPKAGTGTGLTWSTLPAGNGYYVIGTNATTSCVSPASNAVNVSANANPVALVLSGSTICVSPGGNGTITSTTSVSGVNYQLYNASNAAVQTVQPGTGSGLTWSSLPAGNGYYVIGTNALTSCVSTNSNVVNVSTTANPVALVLTGSTICVSPGDNGTITSTTSVNGVSYQLFNSSNAPVQGAQAGNGSGLTWTGLLAGNGYHIIATNASTCTATSTPVNVLTTANPAALVLTGSTICVTPGGNGTITSTTSVTGVTYQLYNSLNTPVQVTQVGNGSGLTWTGLLAGDGYYVISTNTATCSATSTPVNISTISNPAAPSGPSPQLPVPTLHPL